MQNAKCKSQNDGPGLTARIPLTFSFYIFHFAFLHLRVLRVSVVFELLPIGRLAAGTRDGLSDPRRIQY